MMEVLNFFGHSADRVFGLCIVIAVFFWGLTGVVRAMRGLDE